MPNVRLYYEDMEWLIGASKDTIMSRLAMMGADIGKRAEEDHVDVEFFPDRPDLYSPEGVARAMQGFLGLKTGLANYQVQKGSIVLLVEESVKAVRPIMAAPWCAVLSSQTRPLSRSWGCRRICTGVWAGTGERWPLECMTSLKSHRPSAIWEPIQLVGLCPWTSLWRCLCVRCCRGTPKGGIMATS